MTSCVLNHIALMVEDAERLKDFYTQWFGFEELHRTAEGSIYLTDGHFNLGLLKQGAVPWEDEQRLGTHHIGFTIDSIAEIEHRLKEYYPSLHVEKRPPQAPYGEYRMSDPEGNMIIDLSEKGYGVDATTMGRIPGIRHIATLTRDIPAKFEFWQKVFGLEDAHRTETEVQDDIALALGEEHRYRTFVDNALYCGDGFMNLAVLPMTASRDVGSKGRGVDHFGILCRDPRSLAEAMVAAAPDSLMDTRQADRQAEYRFLDPEGNPFDMSEKKGWKVGANAWARLKGVE
jgi:catechol 2,3-dioxygenase-like lactoylglutathione lyase family enzyme